MNNLVILRNDLKNKKPPRYKVIGITSELILSKKVFENNRNIIPFLDKVFDIEFREYVISSRTNIVARTSRIIYQSEDIDYIKYKNNLYDFIDKLIDANGDTKNIFDGWL
ncbi:MAG: hypothetical protein WBO99_03410 [Leptotrichiaceae bacterium]|jgi:hypothetical protein